MYYERTKTFYIEIEDNIDWWEAPFVFSPYIKNKENFVVPERSLQWVRSRIVPIDRQNLGDILKNNGLEYYDEFSLLEKCKGRCEQDDFHISKRSKLPEHIKKRFVYRVKDVIPTSDNKILVFFNNETTKIYDPADYGLDMFLKSDNRLKNVEVAVGGYGICWGSLFFISATVLNNAGKEIPISYDDFIFFIERRTYSTADVCEYLKCSRQNVADLSERNKLQQVKKSSNNNLFLKQEVDSRLWN